jgi:hypothetical protein
VSEKKPFRVEVAIAAPRDLVWRALTEPAEIRRWFGWDYEGLDEEIRYIFVDHATPQPPDRIELDGGEGAIEVVADGPRTVVRVVRPGPLGDAAWEDLYDEMEEGWRAFFQQLRYALERRPGEDRRTLFLAGEAVAGPVVEALAARLPGRPCHESRHQRAVEFDRYGGGLAVVKSPLLDAPASGQVWILLTTYGLDDGAFADLRGDWSAWWSAVAKDPQVTAA